MQKEFKQAVYQLLKFKQPTIQKAAFKCLLAYKQPAISNYQEQIEKIIDPQTFRDAVRTFRLDTSLYSSDHRVHIAGVLLRILYGRLQLSKGQFTSAVFTNLALCTDAELNLFLSFLLDPLIKESESDEMATLCNENKLNESIQYVRQRVQRTVQGNDSLSWPRLHALSKIVDQALMYMGHRLNIVSLNDNETANSNTDEESQMDTVNGNNNKASQNEHDNNVVRADILLRLSLCLLAMVYEVKVIKSQSSNITNLRLPLSSQMKSVRSAGSSLLIHLFSSKWLCSIEFWNNNTNNNSGMINDVDTDVVQRSLSVKQVCCNPFVLDDILQSSSVSVNHLLIQLGSLWSSSSCLASKFLNQSLVKTFVTLLNNHYTGTVKLKNDVIEKLIEIIHNLAFLPDVCTIGRGLLLPFHAEIVNYLHKRLQELCQAKSTFFANLGKQPQSGLRLQREFQVVGYLAQLPEHDIDIGESGGASSFLSPTEGEKLLQALLQLLSRSAIRSLRTNTNNTPRSASFKRRALVNSDESAALYDLQLATGETVEAELIQSILHLVHITKNISEHYKKILYLFVCSKSRVARSLLCQVVGVCSSRLNTFPLNLLELLKKLIHSNNDNLKNEQKVDSLKYLKKYLSNSEDAVNNLIQNVLKMLNSWDQSYIEQPDVPKRDEAFNLLVELCLLLKLTDPPEQTVFLHIAGLNCAIYTICNEDLQLRDTALDYAVCVIQSIESRLVDQKLNESDVYYQELIIKCLWPNLITYLRDSAALGPKRLHLLRLLNTVVRVYRSRCQFAPLALLLDINSSNNDFYTNLQSGTLQRQSCAIRRLALFLHNPLTIISRRQLSSVNNQLFGSLNKKSDFPIPQKDLRNLFLPILWFYLEPELHSPTTSNNSKQLDYHKKLIEYCLDAIGALAKHLHWKSYRILLESVICRLNSCVNTNLASQIIINLIDAFQPPDWKVSIKSTQEEEEEEEEKQTDEGHTVAKITPHPKLLPSSSSSCQSENSSILNYMLSVIKRLEPFIVKPTIKTKKKTENPTDNDNRSNNNQPLKISLVISLVMLLRRLPTGYLESRLPHLLLRVVDILRPSRDIHYEVRSEAVKSLSRMARLLGPGKALDKMFEVVSQQLNRGGYTYWQVRLYALHRVLGEVEQAVSAGEVAFKPGQLDNVGRILGRLYLDEMVGRLAEEMDSRRSGAQAFSDTRVKDLSTSNDLGGSTATIDLPEANGFKSPEGVARLCRLLSPDGIINLFTDIKTALSCAVSGGVLEQMLNQTTSASTTKSSAASVGCGLRFRHRALARLECTLSRLPTKNAIFSNKYISSDIHVIIKLFQQLVDENLAEISIPDENSQLKSENTSNTIGSQNSKTVTGWLQPQSKPLEPRWRYLEVEKEPARENNSLTTQSGLTQAHVMACCGLYLFVGLIRYQWLKQDEAEHLQLMSSLIPSIITCLNSKYVQVLEVAVKCVRLLLLIATSKSTAGKIQKFQEYLNTIGEKLFSVLANQHGLLSAKTASSNCHAQNLASGLYRALASLVRHQYSYPLSRSQLLTLLNAVDIELNRDATVSPSLSLLHAILQRRLRDPSIQTADGDFLSLLTDPEVSKELPVKGLVVAKLSDRDHDSVTGAGGGTRLLDLFSRLQVLAITSPSDQIRAESRCCLITFLLNYPHKVKFLHSFVAFCVRQLEYKKSAGRLSAASLLSGLISDLPITRLMGSSHLDEAILLSVGAAIERESARKSRSTLLSLIRLLFSKLPIDAAQSYFSDYLLAFLTAPAESRCSARLLGLQMITSVLDSQPCLSALRHRNNLIDILSNDVLPIAAIQLNKLLMSNPSLVIASGLNELYNMDSMKTPKEECELVKVVKEDSKWMSELKLPTTDIDNDEDNDDVSDDAEGLKDDNGDDLDGDNDEEEEVLSLSDEEMKTDGDYDIDMEDEDAELDAFANSADNIIELPSNTPQAEPTYSRKLKCLKSAIDNQYFLVAHTMEHSLKLIYHLVTSSKEDKTNTNDSSNHDIDSYISSVKLSPFWRVLLNGPKYDNSLPITELQSKKAQKALKKRREQYSTLFSGLPEELNVKSKKVSLLVTGHRETREWATRCLSLLLKLEVTANNERLASKEAKTMNSEASGINARSNIFKKLQKSKSGLNKVLLRLLDGLLFQLQTDARVPISDEWSNSLLSNLIYLGQLLHLTVGRKPVLRIFRVANKIALDELNNRPQYYCQRILALKLITGLLLRLPHPHTNVLFDMFSLTKSQEIRDKQEEESVINDDSLKKDEQAPAYFAYLRSASKLLSREFRHRERLAFIAASSLSANVNDDSTDVGARIRLRGIHLSKELTVRAKSRRRRAQARLRRALMSGTIRPESAQSLVASVSAGMAKAGPDQLIDLIESTDSALTQELGDGNHQLIQIICSRASLGARAIRERRNLHKATRDALGVAWSGPVKKKSKLDDQPELSLEVESSNINEDIAFKQPCQRKRRKNEEPDGEQHKKKKRQKC
ncbi:unnamed protein product [Trichobilharzia szidati]|nr:unnamed protein product [Trichobilharzia szidati]